MRASSPAIDTISGTADTASCSCDGDWVLRGRRFLAPALNEEQAAAAAAAYRSGSSWNSGHEGIKPIPEMISPLQQRGTLFCKDYLT
ncbi:hypothetical protein EJB05_28274, partial [Eragrostis curvula]